MCKGAQNGNELAPLPSTIYRHEDLAFQEVHSPFGSEVGPVLSLDSQWGTCHLFGREVAGEI